LYVGETLGFDTNGQTVLENIDRVVEISHTSGFAVAVFVLHVKEGIADIRI